MGVCPGVCSPFSAGAGAFEAGGTIVPELGIGTPIDGLNLWCTFNFNLGNESTQGGDRWHLIVVKVCVHELHGVHTGS